MRDRAVGGQAGGRVGQRGDVPDQARVQPRLAQVRRVDGQALAQGEPGGRGTGGELVDVRPGAFGVDVVRGQRGDAAPVVDAGPQDEVVLGADQVGRGLDAGRRPEDEPGHGDRGGQVVEFGVGDVAHLGVRLGPEVLHDDFLDAVVGAGDLPDREDRVGALGRGLADADEDAGGERDVAAAGVLQDAEPDRRVLVRAAEVGAALLGVQAGGRGLEHHAHRRGDRLEALEVLPGQDARVEVGQQAGFLQDADRHGPYVGQGVVVAAGVEPLAGLAPAVLRPVAEGEQGFLAAHCGALASDIEDLVRLQVQAVQPVRDGGEGAVPAAVPAQPGQRDEDLARVGDRLWPIGRLQACVPGPARVGQQGLQVIAAGVEEDRRLVQVERLAVPGPRQGPAHRRGRDPTSVAAEVTHAAPNLRASVDLPGPRGQGALPVRPPAAPGPGWRR